MSNGTYADHYEKYLSVYEEMAMANGGKTVWIPTDAHDGWYVSSPVDDEDSEAWEKGYPNKSRPSVLPDDLTSDVERTAYTTISYALDESYTASYYKETSDGVEWMNDDSNRLPDYDSIVAWALFVDIDISSEYKRRPLPEDHREVIEQRLKLWVKAFGALAGSTEHIHLLDSGGGMYVFVPPTALSPISERYDKEERGLIFNEIGKRMRTVTGQLDDLICAEDDAPKELFSADKVQNKNRQFKTIGAIHKNLDSVVHPLDPEEPTVSHKRVDDISDSDIERAMDWAKSFTSDEHTDCVGSVVEYLFQGRFTKRDDIEIDSIEGNSWEDILDTWVEERKESIRNWKEAQEQRDQIEDTQLRTEITQDKDVAQEAIRRINNRKLKEYIVNFLGNTNTYPKSSSEEMDFYPFWRPGTESGRSAFYDYYEGKARFTDKADGTSRDIVYWIALEMTYDDEEYPNTRLIDEPGESLTGHDYKRAIKELRNRGENVPILVPEVDEDEEEGDGKDQLADWHIVDIGRELGIIDDKDVIEHENTETLIPSAWNRILDRLDAEDITHNRERKTPLTADDINPPRREDYTGGEMKETFYSDSDPTYSMSPDRYEEFLDKLPEHVVAFTYSDEIAGGPADSILVGVFAEQDSETATITHFEPNAVGKETIIDSERDLTIETKEPLKKMDMKILVPEGDIP